MNHFSYKVSEVLTHFPQFSEILSSLFYYSLGRVIGLGKPKWELRFGIGVIES